VRQHGSRILSPRRAAISFGFGAVAVAFTVGMSYAVSDTEPATTVIRKTSLGRALLSHGFGTITGSSELSGVKAGSCRSG
jgi:uncharacterized membrane protein